MRNTILGMLIGGLLVALGMGVTHAQNPALTPYQVTVTAKCVGNMNTSLAGQATYCQGIDGAFVSMNGSVPVQYAPPSATVAGVQKVTINSIAKTPDASGNVSFQITSAAPIVTTPTISASSSAPSASAPAITAQ